MMNLLQGASDDQVALIGCLVALISSAGLMYVSFFVGPAARRGQTGPNSATKGRHSNVRPVIEMPSESVHERAA